jgi:hypothetical protein
MQSQLSQPPTQIGIHHTSGENASSIRPKGQKIVASPQQFKDEQEATMDPVEVEKETMVEAAKETKETRTTPT